MNYYLILVDDDEDDREMFREAVAEVAPDCCFTGIDDAAVAFRYLVEKTSRCDLILLDINLPLISGWDLLQKIKANSELSDLPVMMYSTSSSSLEKVKAKELGAICLITKPFSFSRLKDLVVKINQHFELGKLHEFCPD